MRARLQIRRQTAGQLAAVNYEYLIDIKLGHELYISTKTGLMRPAKERNFDFVAACSTRRAMAFDFIGSSKRTKSAFWKSKNLALLRRFVFRKSKKSKKSKPASGRPGAHARLGPARNPGAIEAAMRGLKRRVADDQAAIKPLRIQIDHNAFDEAGQAVF